MQIAAKFSCGLGRQVVHVKLSEQERVQQFLSMHMPEQLAKFITSLEVLGANGAEDRMNDVVETVTGRLPQKSMHGWKRTRRLGSRFVSERLRAQLSCLLFRASFPKA